MKIRLKIDRELLVSQMKFDPETGIGSWLARDNINLWDRSFNANLASKNIGTIGKSGYLNANFNGKRHSVHRLAWVYYYGEPPVGVIDHINGIKTDNRIVNLRDVSQSHNCQNRKVAATNNLSSGLLGVTWSKKSCKWQAQIGINGKLKYLGLFVDKYLAHEAYLSEKRKHHKGCTI